MDVPPLPAVLRRTPTHLTANMAEAVLVQWSRRFRTVEAGTGLTPERLELLAVIAAEGTMSAGDLSEALGVTAPAVTRMVNGLEVEGLVRKSTGHLDRRIVFVHLTAAGRRVMERGRANRVREMAANLRGLNDRELAQLDNGLRILRLLLD
ncbi:MAG: MarR family transcriptional regulator [Acidimicrobiia bacterium]